MKIEIEEIQPKLLTEPCWIELRDGFEVRIDYLTRGEEAELRRLKLTKILNYEEKEHPLNYYLRKISKEIRGLKIGGNDATLEVTNNEASNVKFGNDENEKVDFITLLFKLELWELFLLKAEGALSFSDIDKKKLQSQRNLSNKESLTEITSDSSPAES